MPFIANAANQMALQNAANLGDGLAAIGQALNNPQAWANADLMRVQKEKLLNDIDIQNKTFGLAEAKQPYELKVLGAQAGAQNAAAAANNAQAGYYNANRGKVEIETQGITRQWEAQNKLGDALVQGYGVTPQQAAVAQTIAQAANDSNSQQLGNMIMGTLQREPVKASSGDTVFFAPNDPRKPVAAGVGTALTQSGPVMTGNAATVPSGSKSAVGSPTALRKTLEYSDRAVGALGMADEAARLNNLDSLANARNPLGGIPGLSSLANWYQQFSGDPAAADRNAYQKLGVSEFLSSVEKMKGAITEREGAYLRQTQPPDYADAAIKSKWLEAVEYTARMQADWDNLMASAVQNGSPIPDAVQWKQTYLQNNPAPALLSVVSSGTSSAPTAVNPPKPGRPPLSTFKR